MAFDTQLAINSGATINISSDDFTNGTVVASGSSSATISLINNFWGTINPTQIAAKITDHANNPNLPNVTYEPFLSENATATYASNASVIYSPNAQTVTLSATVISADGPVNGGTETFTILNGSTVIGTPITYNVVSGAASGTYTIPTGTLGGVYTIQAVFSGTSTLSGSSDSSHTLAISDAATTTAASSATTIFSGFESDDIPERDCYQLGGHCQRRDRDLHDPERDDSRRNPRHFRRLRSGSVTASYTLPGGSPVGIYTIEAVYNGTVDYGTSTDTIHSLTINAPGPTIMWNTTTAPTGGDWDTPGNWVGGVVPTAVQQCRHQPDEQRNGHPFDRCERRRPEPDDKRKHRIEHRKRVDRAWLRQFLSRFCDDRLRCDPQCGCRSQCHDPDQHRRSLTTER